MARDGVAAYVVDRVGIEPTSPILQGSVAAVGPARLREVRPGVEPGLPPYHGGVRPRAPTDQWRVRGSHPAVVAYEASMGAGPPAITQIRNPNVETRPGSPCGIRTRIAGLKAQHPEPLEERAVFSRTALRREGSLLILESAPSRS